jgi:photosystem II stability/assembly factor-like uncharacterized protein
VRQGTSAQIPDVELFRVFAIDDQIAWVSGDLGVILHIDNGGATWTRQGQGTVPEVHLGGSTPAIAITPE